jgi:hypothetical protein
MPAALCCGFGPREDALRTQGQGEGCWQLNALNLDNENRPFCRVAPVCALAPRKGETPGVLEGWRGR